MAQITPPDPNPPRDCYRCQAPLGVSDTRCPFCGAEQGLHAQPPSVKPPPFEAATIGLTDQVKQRQAPQPARQPGSDGKNAAVALIGVLVLASGGLLAYRKLNPPPPPPAPSKPPPLAPVVSSVGGLPIPDIDRVDPTDLIPLMRRTVAPKDPDSQLLSIQVKGSKNGVVDLRRPESSVVYTFALLAETQPHRPKTPQAARSYVLKLNNPGPQDMPLGKDDQPMPEPNCVWSAAYRAALRSGVPSDVYVDGVYGRFGGEPRWRISVDGKPEFNRDIDGMSCVIKVH